MAKRWFKSHRENYNPEMQSLGLGAAASRLWVPPGKWGRTKRYFQVLLSRDPRHNLRQQRSGGSLPFIQALGVGEATVETYFESRRCEDAVQEKGRKPPLRKAK